MSEASPLPKNSLYVFFLGALILLASLLVPLQHDLLVVEIGNAFGSICLIVGLLGYVRGNIKRSLPAGHIKKSVPASPRNALMALGAGVVIVGICGAINLVLQQTDPSGLSGLFWLGLPELVGAMLAMYGLILLAVVGLAKITRKRSI